MKKFFVIVALILLFTAYSTYSGQQFVNKSLYSIGLKSQPEGHSRYLVALTKTKLHGSMKEVLIVKEFLPWEECNVAKRESLCSDCEEASRYQCMDELPKEILPLFNDDSIKGTIKAVLEEDTVVKRRTVYSPLKVDPRYHLENCHAIREKAMKQYGISRALITKSSCK